MMAAGIQEFTPRGEMRFDEPMSKHTSWRVGGPAERFFVPADKQDLIDFIRTLERGTPITWVGLGSNLLVRDAGIRGVVVATHKCLRKIETVADNRIYIEAGVPGAKIARYSAMRDLIGAEFFAGIPGTFGGALAMNAGAFEGETWDVVCKVETLDQIGRVRTRSPMEFTVGYRSVAVPAGEWFLSGEVLLTAGDGAQGREKIRKFLVRRATTQPIQLPNAGSIFRNPEGDYAARLIESAGLKGTREGGAVVSDLHANFIVNRANATASDIEALIGRVQRTVLETHGVELIREVRIIGEARS
jgi:UDP-N-acetylmuramate dehydrogenase